MLVQELSDAAALEVALIENIQRQDLTPVEEAEGYRRLTEEFDRTQDELSRALGKSRSHIANALRLLHLPDAVKLLLNGGAISAGHGRALLNAPDPTAVAMEIVRRNLTVRETERLIAGETGTGQRRGPRPRTAKSDDILEIERRLYRMLGVRITITPRAAGKPATSRSATPRWNSSTTCWRGCPRGCTTTRSRGPRRRSEGGWTGRLDLFISLSTFYEIERSLFRR